MRSFEQELKDATDTQHLPAVVLAASTGDGSLNYLRYFGNQSLKEGAPPVGAESVMCLASVTKIVTNVAAMQCVERGLIDLDEDVTKYLPEWKDPMILKGFDEEDGGKPILEKAKNKITLRLLLSHTSGISFFENGRIIRYFTYIGDERATLIKRYFMSNDPVEIAEALPDVQKHLGCLTVEPLLFEPGTDWNYGQGTDWAGQLIERICECTLEDYCQKNIFQPLGMHHTTYRLLHYPEIHRHLIAMSSRREDMSIENVESIYPLDPTIDMGGSGLYTSGPDFLAFLTSLLRNDGKLLKPETANLMFDYRLPDTETYRKWKTTDVVGNFEGAREGDTQDHCLGGIVNCNDIEGKRRAGSVAWAGATRCYWWIDRKAGICGFYGSQMNGMRDKGVSNEKFEKFERAVYADNCKGS